MSTPEASANVAAFLRQRKDLILASWEARVTAEGREVELVDLALRDDVPGLLDELAEWTSTDAPATALFGMMALAHVNQRLDAGLSLSQVLREYRLLREVIIEHVLDAEGAEQTRGGVSDRKHMAVRVEQLARLNSGLDVMLSRSIEHFVEERDRREELARARVAEVLRKSDELTAYLLELSDAIRPFYDTTAIHEAVTRTARRHFRADRCFFCEIEGSSAVIRSDDSRKDLPSVVGTYALDENPIFKAALGRSSSKTFTPRSSSTRGCASSASEWASSRSSTCPCSRTRLPLESCASPSASPDAGRSPTSRSRSTRRSARGQRSSAPAPRSRCARRTLSSSRPIGTRTSSWRCSLTSSEIR